MKNGFAALITLFFILFVSAFILGLIYFSKNSATNQSAKQVSISQQAYTASPTPLLQADYTNAEIHDFPIYPGAVFNERLVNPICNGTENLTTKDSCGTILYKWETKDNYTAVKEWYEGPARNNWKCSGSQPAFNNPRNASGTAVCDVGDKVYHIYFIANPVKTEIGVYIPAVS